MSQLNSNKNTAKKTFLMLLIFTIVCAGVTVALIHNTLNLNKEITNTNLESNQVEKQEIPVAKSTVEKVELTDKYFTNGIIIEERNISFGDVINEYANNVQRKLEINYPQISGLKNKAIQDKINKDIENQVLSLRDDNQLNEDNVERIGIYAHIMGSFSDVLSVSITKSVIKFTNVQYEYDYEYENIGLNYSLKDGMEIKFNDLFTEDAGIKNIITQSVYNSLAWDYAEESGNMDADMSTLDYSDIEDRVFKILSRYRNDSNLDFYFSPSTIFFIVDNNSYSIEMADFFESIAIYTRYKSDRNLYEDEFLVKNYNYVFSNFDGTDFIVEEAKKTDNFRFRILKNSSEEYTDEEIQNVEKMVLDKLYKKINNYAIAANKNKDKGYIYDVVYSIFEYEGKIGYHYDGYLCSMDRNYFNDELENTMALAMRREMVELWSIDYSYIDSENITFEESSNMYVSDYTSPTEDEVEQVITQADRERIEEENVY